MGVSQVRIISGDMKGRKFEAPPSSITRPISDRAKEGIFNMLMTLDGVADSTVLDLFCGSGSFGLECLSRGASFVHFVDSSRQVCKIVSDNANKLFSPEKFKVHCSKVENVIADFSADIAFCDPPYADDPWSNLISQLKVELLVAHSEREVELNSDWVELRRKKYGRSKILIARSKNSSNFS